MRHAERARKPSSFLKSVHYNKSYASETPMQSIEFTAIEQSYVFCLGFSGPGGFPMHSAVYIWMCYLHPRHMGLIYIGSRVQGLGSRV